MSRPLHERVSAALDSVPADLAGTEVLRHIESAYAHDPELIEECRQLLSDGGGSGTTLPGLASGAASASRDALERLHDRLVGHGTIGASSGHGSGDGARVDESPIPEFIGPYRVLRRIGEGGMGLVYEAEQTSPRRRVAIKVIRGVGTRAARARFRTEAQALANLKHPGIAQIIEAHFGDAPGAGAAQGTGVGAVGSDAYFVMEFVEGPSLTAFAAARGVSMPERVELVAKVCDAVQHAHQKGVIHRDLKPANILVEQQPGAAAQPKVLDFGVAKLVQGEESSATLALDAARIVGTLAYMSPEALDIGTWTDLGGGGGGGGGGGVDTRADVYALGVILYEMLSGKLPISVASAGLTEVARRIQGVEPPPLAQHNAALRGDLSLIAATALAKDRERRYASAAELAADLRRFLRHEPIAARPPSTLYTLGKFVRRRRALAAAVSLAAVSVVAGGAFSTTQYLRAESALEKQTQLTDLAQARLVEQQKATKRADDATKRAEAVKRYLLTDLIVAATPERLGADAKINDALDAAYTAIPDRFADQPGLRAEILQEFSGVYNLLGRADPALDAAKRAANEAAAMYGEEDERTIAAQTQLVIVLNSAGKFPESEPLLSKLVPLAEARLAPDNPTRLRIAAGWGNLLQSKGETEKAIEVLASSAVVAERALPISDGIRSSLRNNLAAAYLRAGKVPEAVDTLAKLIEEQEAALSPTDPAVLSAMNNHVNGLIRLKRYDEAVTRAEDLVQRVDRSHPARHPARGFANATFAAALQRAGQLDRARDAAEQAYNQLRDALDEADWATEQTARRLADIEMKRGAPDGARTWAVEAQKIRCFSSGAGERDSLIKSFEDEGKRLVPASPRDTAAGLVAELVSRADEKVPPGHPRRARYLANLARATAAFGDAAVAANLLQSSRDASGTGSDQALTDLIEAIAQEIKRSPEDGGDAR